MADPGDRVKVEYDGKEVVGVLIPNKESDSIVIKLDNGYNIGIDNAKVKGIKVVEKHKAKKEVKKKALSKSKKPMISILHTGGTIASKVDYETGGVSARFSPEELVEMFPEIKDLANIRSNLISNMWSEDMRFVHYQIIVEAILKEIKAGASGIILTHGTDTLAFTSAALAFMFEEIPLPVLVVGAQRSSDRPSSDAALNLISAIRFMVKTDFAGVGICMHEDSQDESCVILPATKTRKFHTSKRNAFTPVNDTPVARIGHEIKFLKKDYSRRSKRKPKVKDKFEDRVAILKLHPNMHPDQFSYYRDFGFKGIVLEGTGLGQAPTGVPNKYCAVHKRIKEELRKLIDSGTIVVMTSQCIYGRVHMHVYDKAIDLTKMGVIPGEDMLTETAFIKLAWLLGNYTPEEAKILVGKNLRGEITKRRL